MKMKIDFMQIRKWSRDILIIVAFVILAYVMTSRAVWAISKVESRADNQLTVTVTQEHVAPSLLLLNDDGKSVWRYIGPETREDLEITCDELNWESLVTANPERVRTVEATVKKEGDRVVEVSHVFDLPEDASNAVSYCFAIPTVSSDGKNPGWAFSHHRLVDFAAAPEPLVDGIKLEKSAPLPETQIPSSIILSASSADLELQDWRYVFVDDQVLCDDPEQAAKLSYMMMETDSQGRGVHRLKADMTGKILCIRAQDLNSSNYHYLSYVVPDSVNTPPEESGSRIWIVATVIVLALGVVVFLLIRRQGNS